MQATQKQLPASAKLTYISSCSLVLFPWVTSTRSRDMASERLVWTILREWTRPFSWIRLSKSNSNRCTLHSSKCSSKSRFVPSKRKARRSKPHQIKSPTAASAMTSQLQLRRQTQLAMRALQTIVSGPWSSTPFGSNTTRMALVRSTELRLFHWPRRPSRRLATKKRSIRVCAMHSLTKLIKMAMEW